jgi:hypothetical protein
MMTKERLLAGLHELVYVEEGLLAVYANFGKVLVAETPDSEVSPEVKGKMDRLLSVLHSDSTRHKEIVDGLILKVAGSTRDEY